MILIDKLNEHKETIAILKGTEKQGSHEFTFLGHHLPDGTYELCGEKVQGNPENIVGHVLIPHGKDVLDITDLSFEGLRQYLEVTDIEGIVFHDKLSDKMCKIRKSDFGIKR